MINADVYSAVNENTAKYTSIVNMLKVHEQMMDWRPQETVLDVGCGPGDVTSKALQKWLPSDFRYLLGLDVSTNMIKHAQANNSNEKLEFAVFDIGQDCSEILKKEKYSKGFDKIFSFYTFHWIDNLERCVENLYALMKPGGFGLVTFPMDRYFQKAFIRVRTKPQWSEYFKHVSEELPPFPTTTRPAMEFRMILESKGFHVTLCETHSNLCVFESEQKFKGLIESVDAEIESVPLHRKSEYLSDCFKALQEMKAVSVEGGSNLVTQYKIMLTCVFRRPAQA